MAGFLDDLRKQKAELDAAIAESLTYYLPPHLRPLVGLVAEANPVVSMERAGTASRGMLSRDATPTQRAAYAGDMLSNMAGVAAPAMVAGRAGVPAANAISEGLTGIAATARMPEFIADESGALRLFHGSPHDFDKFRMDKIGTGEGAQAYGHGLYFAESPDVAKGYRDQLSRPKDMWTEQTPNGVNVKYRTRDGKEMSAGVFDPSKGDVFDQAMSGPFGRMYEVNVNANPEDFLDWDKPLSEQPQKVRDAFSLLGTPERLENVRGEDAYRALGSKMGALDWPVGADAATRRSFYNDAAVKSSEALQNRGIPGIRYLDAGSRGAGDGSRNYVVFDENLIDIVRKYGIAGAATLLGISQADIAQAVGANSPQQQGTPFYTMQDLDKLMGPQ